MTDANGARNINPSDTRSGSFTSSKSGAGSTGAGSSAHGPKLNIPSSRILPKEAPEKGDPRSSKASADTPRTRYRANSTKPARRSRRTRNGAPNKAQNPASKNTHPAGRRLFGTAPDRVKRKSSSRTRALKARIPSPAEKKLERGHQLQTASGKASSAAALTARQGANTTEKGRPALPATSYPGQVPPSRALVRKRRRASRRYAPFRRGAQFIIIGLGIAAIAGTLLKMRPEAPASTVVSETTTQEATPAPKAFPMPLSQEIVGLKASLQSLPNSYPGMTPKIFYIDVDTAQYVSVEGSETIAAASTIKLPILLAFFEEIDAGRIDPNQTIEIQQTQIAEGSGDMQLSSPGTQFTALEVASQMIINSDNTATNMMIDLLGGRESLNNRFKLQGLEKTVLNNPLPDLEGTNTTSARDLVHTMLLISQGEELSMRSRDRVLNILNRTYNKQLLSADPEAAGALTYNKTGDIKKALGDVALVDLPNGKRYAIAAIVERPDNDGRASELIRSISKQTYQEAAKAIQSAVTPLGNSEESSADSDTEASPQPAGSTRPPTTEEVADPVATPEEEPYPSANP
ncbi:MAG: serine hydrolase [Cyanobacteria bacterium J06559_1]